MHLPGLGVVNLADLPEEVKDKLYEEDKLPYLQLTPAARAEKYPDEVITAQKIIIKKDAEAKKDPVSAENDITIDEMKSALKEKGVSFHHKLGDDKIKTLYQENM